MKSPRIIIRAAVVLAGCCAQLPAGTISTLYFSNTGGQTSGFNLSSNPVTNIGFSTSNGSVSAPTGPIIERVEDWSSTANLTAGTERLFTHANILGGTIDITDAFVNTFATFGDTVTYTGAAFGNLNLTARVSIDGSLQTFSPGGSDVTNYSYLRILFLKPGSFDTSNFFSTGNVITQALYGIGSNAQPLPFDVPYNGVIPLDGTPVDLPISFTNLLEGSQIVIQAGNWVEGTMTPGGLGVSWTMDLSSTLHAELIAPAGVTVTTAGGLPVATSSSAPEPSSVTLFLFAALAFVPWRKRAFFRRARV